MKYFCRILEKKHRKKEFSCGKEMLDSYIKNQAGQDIRRKLSACFVLNDEEKQLIKAYYTLSNSSIPLDIIPEIISDKLPAAYKSIPVTLLGRLAVDSRYQKQGIGNMILIDALKRSYDASKEIGSFAVIVDPIDREAERFYIAFGFIILPDSGKMFLPMKTVKELFYGTAKDK